MKLTDIHSAIFHKLGIAELNPMQLAMSEKSLAQPIMLLAPTGSGKTIAFAIGLLRSLGPAGRGFVQGIVVAPGRELVLQVAEVLRSLGAAAGYKTVAFYGGHSMAEEERSLEGGTPDIIVATPGRLVDHIQRGQVSLHDTLALVLDEYDKSVELGFYEDMRKIVGRMVNMKTLILTSATRSSELPDFLPDKKEIHVLDFVTADGDSAPGPKFRYHTVVSEERDKLRALDTLLRSIASDGQAGRTMVFVNHRESAERVAGYLQDRDFPVALYHGKLEQTDREKAVAMFNNGSAPIMVCTDLAARGLDVEGGGVDAVVHYHMPVTADVWTHRNGRTSRQGAEGDVYIISSEADSPGPFIPRDAPVLELHPDAPVPEAPMQTLHINAGKKEKISRGDIAGFFLKKGGLEPDELGAIDLKDHCAFVAVRRGLGRKTIENLAPFRLKNTRVRITQVK